MIYSLLHAVLTGVLTGLAHYFFIARPLLNEKEEVEAERDKYKQLLEFRDGKLPNVLFGDARINKVPITLNKEVKDKVRQNWQDMTSGMDINASKVAIVLYADGEVLEKRILYVRSDE